MKLLLLKDDDATRVHLERTLVAAGYVVDVCSDGRHAIFLGSSNEYAVLSFDRMVPGIDGLGVLKALRAAAVRSPALLLNVIAGVHDRVEGLDAGADDYLGGRPELVVLLAFALTAMTLLVILFFGSEVMEGDTKAFDIAVLTRLRHATEGDAPWKTALRAAMLDLTALGDNATLVIVVAMVSGFLMLARQKHLALLLVVASATGGLLTTALKLLFDRPRPDVVAHLTSFGTASFPSGHAMNSAVIYLTLAGVIALAVPTARLRVYILCCAVALTSAIGLSRLYLGVHWSTDVVAGWIAGSGWAVLWWSIAWWFQARTARLQ